MKPRWRTSLAMHRRSSTRPRPTRAASPEYQRAVALVSRGASGAIKGAEGVASAAEAANPLSRNAGGQPPNRSAAAQATEDAIAALAELEKGELFPSLESTLEDKIDALKVEIEAGPGAVARAAEMAQTALEGGCYRAQQHQPPHDWIGIRAITSRLA